VTRPGGTARSAARPTSPRRPISALDAVTGTILVIVVTACSGLLGFWAALLVPLRIGGVLCPVAILVAVATTWAAPMSLRYAGLPLPARFPPLIVWFAVIVALGAGRPEGDRLLPAGDLIWVTYGVMLGGAVAGASALLRPELRVDFGP
jgi:hypothetical protein